MQFNKVLIVWTCDLNCLVSPKFLKNLSVTGIQMKVSSCDVHIWVFRTQWRRKGEMFCISSIK